MHKKERLALASAPAFLPLIVDSVEAAAQLIQSGSMSSLLSRLRYESKKTTTKLSRAKDREIEYRVKSIELFGEKYLMKAVHVKNSLGYTVGWILDSQTQACMRCDSGFGMTKWRHHCRRCGPASPQPF
jgi:hypothetical protein